ncbi:MAG: trigger factor [Patescibacteria group bacterium]|nr:trigger factor [Patescibacteria group bacterium]
MQITKKELEKSQIELAIELSEEEVRPQLEKAAQALSAQQKIPGFRPGKVPYDLAKNKFGEMTIYQAALDAIINDSFYKAIIRENLETVGQPKIDVEKIAPGNPIIYKATVSILPKVVLGQWTQIQIQKNKVEVKEEDLAKTITQLQSMRAEEKLVDRAAKNGDKVEVDFEVLINKAVIEGGKSQKYPLIIGEKQMIPGFEEQLIGLKAGDKKEFELKFPEKYFQKNLANRLATFKVTLAAVYQRNLAEANDDFAKKLGFDNLAKLKEQLQENIKQDKENKENQRLETEIIKELIKICQIGELPENLIDNEIHKMIHELEHNISRQGMDMAGYLKSLNKTHDDLHQDFRAQAIERVQAALIFKQIAKEEKIQASESEVMAEIKKQEDFYRQINNAQALQNIQNPLYKNQVASSLINSRIITRLKQDIIK